MTVALDDLVGKVLGGRYRLVAPLAVGSSARVFLADDTVLRRRVAVKVLHPALAADETFLRRFRAEAQAVAALNHPHVLAVYDWGNDDVPYLVSEFLAGGSLRMMEDAGHFLTPSQALLVGLEATRGLEYAHKRNIVHRDIKPANLLFDDEGRLRIADFGLAKALSEAALTEPNGIMLGTMRYASPEQATGSALTTKSDIYSLALVLIEAVTGSVPFVTDTALGTLMARVDHQLHAPSELGPLATAVERAAHPDPAQRPDAVEFGIALMAAAEDLTRPEPLFLVGAIPRGVTVEPDRDPTLIAPSEILLPADPAAAATLTAASTGVGAAPLVSVPAVVPATMSRALAVRARDVPRPERSPRRWPIALGVLIVLALAGGGLAAALVDRARTHTIPNLHNEPESKVLDAAARYGWVTDKVLFRDESVAQGNVIDTDPAAGQRLAKGGHLTYTLSLGKPLVQLPAGLIGKVAADASDLLSKAGFQLTDPRTDFDETAAKGTVTGVVDQDGKPVSANAPKGSTLTLLVSNGAQQRTVPAGLENQDKDAVAQAIKQLRLTPQLVDAYSDTVAANLVISIDPPPGSKLDVDAAVTITWSKGPAPRPIPNVVGKNCTQAAADLEAVGFVVSGYSGSCTRLVLTTDPPAGELHTYKTQVKIILRSS